MAVGIQLDFTGVTLEQYDEVVERLGYLPGGPAAPGELSHWVAKTEGGIRTVDVWESLEAYETFYRDKIVPVFKEIGIGQVPEAQVLVVHNYLANRRAG